MVAPIRAAGRRRSLKPLAVGDDVAVRASVHENISCGGCNGNGWENPATLILRGRFAAPQDKGGDLPNLHNLDARIFTPGSRSITDTVMNLWLEAASLKSLIHGRARSAGNPGPNSILVLSWLFAQVLNKLRRKILRASSRRGRYKRRSACAGRPTAPRPARARTDGR